MLEGSIAYCCSWWGLDQFSVTQKMDMIKKDGYDGVEMYIPLTEQEAELIDYSAKENNLIVVAHQFRAEGNTLQKYLKSFEDQVKLASRMNVILINSHSGSDMWNDDQLIAFLQASNELSEKYGVKIAHETHRGRIFHSISQFSRILEKFSDFYITADFSHWTTVSESLLFEYEEILNEAYSRSLHIHARVGWAEGPQVPDPFHSLWSKELSRFVDFWKKIYSSFQQQQCNNLSITPEFGPYPYQLKGWLPDDLEEDQYLINLKMKDFLKNKVSC